jgi:ABC-type antimicrobial peptide transport system permease subunit
VVAHAVTQQRREIGIRMALGAAPGHVLSLVASQVTTMIGAGLVLGIAGSAALTRLMTSLLFEVSAMDPAAFAAAAATMTAVGVLAALVPALRATRVDPTIAIRTD